MPDQSYVWTFTKLSGKRRLSSHIGLLPFLAATKLTLRVVTWSIFDSSCWSLTWQFCGTWGAILLARDSIWHGVMRVNAWLAGIQAGVGSQCATLSRMRPAYALGHSSAPSFPCSTDLGSDKSAGPLIRRLGASAWQKRLLAGSS